MKLNYNINNDLEEIIHKSQDLKLGEKLTCFHASLSILRIPNGWIYETWNLSGVKSTTFIPLNLGHTNE